MSLWVIFFSEGCMLLEHRAIRNTAAADSKHESQVWSLLRELCNYTMQLGNVGGQKSTLSLLDHKIFFVSVNQYMQLLLKGSSNSLLWPIYIGKRWSATYHDRGPPSPTGRLSRTQQASLPYHSHAFFCKAARLAPPSSRNACNAPTQWTQTLRWRQPKQMWGSILR